MSILIFFRKFNEKIVENIVKTLKVMNKQMIIIHGGGSFGHIKSKEFGLGQVYFRGSDTGTTKLPKPRKSNVRV